jgi:hypothetical protein
VAAVAYHIGRRSLPAYASRFSRKDFTQPQLFALLVLRQFHKTDYRGIVAIVADNPTLCADLELKKVPHFTTLQKAEAKLLKDRHAADLLAQTVALYFDLGDAPPQADDGNPLPRAQLVEQAAADSTGFELNRASKYFTRRRRKPRKNKGETRPQPVAYRRFAKLGIVVCCASHLILSLNRGVGPGPDVDELCPLMTRFVPNAVPEQLLADAGYDSEENHVMLRDYLSIDSVIPATIGRPTDKLPTGKYRYLMQTDFDDEAYGQRWQSETVMFMLKRHQGESLKARKRWTRHRELGLMAVTHNIMIAHA